MKLYKSLIFIFILLSTFAAIFFAKPISAADFPPGFAYQDGPKSNFQCNWGNTAKIRCSDNGGNFGFDIGFGRGGGFGADYYLDAAATANSGHLVFKADQKIDDHGWLHLTEDAGEGTITNSPTDATGGYAVKPVRNKEIIIGDIEEPDIDGKKVCSTSYLEVGCVNAYTRNETISLENSQDIINRAKAVIQPVKEKVESEANCSSNPAVPLGFIFCEVFEKINDATSAMIGGDSPTETAGERKGLLISFLQLPPFNTQNPQTSALVGVSQNLIAVANALYVIIFLVLIFSGSIPFLNLDSYTIKKMLPRFIIAVILTQFAVPICGAIIDFFNLLGQVVPDIIFSLTSGVGLASSADTGAAATIGANLGTVVGVGGLIALVAQFGFFIIFAIAILALVAGIVAVIYLLLRLIILYTLVILAPLAFACLVLPNTKKVFDQWWSTFWKLNAMYVVIMAMLAISLVLGKALSTVPEIGQVIGPIIPIVALLMVPKTLKWTTQGMNAIAAGALGAVSGAGSKAAGAAKSKASGAAKEAVNQKRLEFGQRLANSRNPFVSGMGAGIATGSSTKAARMKARGGGYVEENIDKYSQELKNASAGRDFGEVQKDLAKLAKGEKSEIFGSAKNKQQQIAAVRELARTGSWGDLRDVAESGALSSEEIMQGIGSNVGDAKAALPDIVVGGSANAYGKVENGALKGGVTAETITKMDTSSIEKLVEHYSTSTEPQVKAAIEKQLEVITQSPELQKSLKPEVRDRLRNIDSRF